MGLRRLLPRRRSRAEPTSAGPDPLKAYKFRARFASGTHEGEFVGLMSVSGLRCTGEPGSLAITRAVFPGDSDLHEWFLHPGDLRDMDIVVDHEIVFHVHCANPTMMVYSDLDAGANTLLVSQMSIAYTRITVEHV